MGNLTEIKLSDGLTASWITCSEGDGMTRREVCSLLGISQSNMSHIIKRNGLNELTMGQLSRRSLKKLDGYAKIKGSHYIIPRESIDKLVKIVNTKESWSRYTEILEAIRSPKKLIELHSDGGQDHYIEYMEKLMAAFDCKIDSIINKIDSMSIASGGKTDIQNTLSKLGAIKENTTQSQLKWYLIINEAFEKQDGYLTERQEDVIRNIYINVIHKVV